MLLFFSLAGTMYITIIIKKHVKTCYCASISQDVTIVGTKILFPLHYNLILVDFLPVVLYNY